MNRLLLLFFVSLMFCIAGCLNRHYPNVYESPEEALEQATNQTFKESPFIPGSWPNVNWWLMFNDCQLNEIMKKALADNPDLKIAQARIRLAKYAAQYAGSPLWPTLGFEADVTRYRVSKTGAIAGFANIFDSIDPVNPQPPPPIGPPGFTFTQWETNLNGQYQFDFWQQNLNNLRAAVGELLATEADTAFSTVMISISVAQAYFNLQVMYAREELAQRRVANRINYLKLVEKRLTNGLDNQVAHKLAQSNVVSAEEALKEVQYNIEIYKNQLHTLMTGNFLEEFNSNVIEKKELVSFELPTDIPLNLLAHRPDVTATAWRVEEYARKIKVAKADFYPNFNIIWLFGYQTIQPREFFKWRSIYGQAGPAVNLPIFEGGALQANLGTAYEQYNIAVEEYNKTILTSVQNVLDSLVGLQYAFRQLQDFIRILEYSEQSLQIVQGRYEHHIDSYLSVLDADLDTILKRDQKLIAMGNYYFRLTQLISALGGGYDNGCTCQ